MPTFKPRLRYILAAAFTVVATVPVLFLGFWVERTAMEKEVAAVSEKHLLLARNITAALDRYAQDTKAAFHYFIELADAETPPAGASDLARSLGFRYFCITDDEGRVSFHITAADKIDERDLADVVGRLRPFTDDSSTSFSDVMADGEGRPTIYLTRRLGPDRIAFGPLNTDYVDQLRKGISFGKRGHAAIVDRSGNLMAHPNPDWRQGMKNIAKVKPVAHMMAGETGVTTFYSPAVKLDMISGYTTVPSTGWGVMVPQPIQELEERARGVQLVALFIIVAGILTAAAISWLLSGLMMRPVEAVMHAARNIAGGALDARVPAPSKLVPEELRELGSTFNAMALDVASNIAERDLTEKNLKDSEERFRNLVEGSIQGIFIHRDFKLLFINDACAGIFGYDDPDSMLALDSILTLFLPEERERVQRYKEAREKGEAAPAFYEARGMRKDGSLIWVEYRIRTVTWHGEPAIQATVVDVTERKRAEAELRQMQKIEAVESLAGGFAHNLNNLLLPILLLAQTTMRNLPEKSGDRENLDKIIQAGERAKGMVSGMLAFSRQDNPKREIVDIHTILQSALALLRSTVPSTIGIKENLDRDTGTVLADAAQIETVLMNLTSNAVHAMDGGTGDLTISLSPANVDETLAESVRGLEPGSYAKLTVTDTGHGMDEASLEHIFDPFFTTKEIGVGTGLGLASAFAIISSHEGAIIASSSPGEGSTFDVYLPLSSLDTGR